MEFDRYAFSDAYIDEELTRTYKRADVNGRIDLLRGIVDQQEIKYQLGVPYVLALLAVEDENVAVREWIAKHGRSLDYRFRENLSDEGKAEGAQHRMQNLAERLKADPDPFVRACLCENPTILDWWGGMLRGVGVEIEHFKDLSTLERLAFMRNPRIYPELVEVIFDHADQDLGLTHEERIQLVAAFTTNQSAVRRSYDTSDRYRDSNNYRGDANHFSRLWRLTSKWPEQDPVVYVGLGAPDSTKAQIYTSCSPEDLRWNIIENCSLDDVETLTVAAQDSVEYLRNYAEDKLLERQNIRKGPTVH